MSRIAHKLASAQPTGTIRLIVLAEDGGSAEPDPEENGKHPQQVVSGTQQAAR